MRATWIFLLLQLMPIAGLAEALTRFTIDGEPLAAGNLYVYTDAHDRTWVAEIVAGNAMVPEVVVDQALTSASADDWKWVIATADDLIYASRSQPKGNHDWRAALAAMGRASSSIDVIALPAPFELDAEIVRHDGRPASHAYGSIALVFDEQGPCGQPRPFQPMPSGLSATVAGRIGWRLAPGRYLLQIGGDTHAVDLRDHDDSDRLVSRRFVVAEQRLLRFRVRGADGRSVPGVMLGNFIDDCIIKNFDSTDGDGALSTWINATDLPMLALRGWNEDGTVRLQALGSIADDAWRSGDEQDLVWHGNMIDSVSLPTPEVSVAAVLPTLIGISFVPPRCVTANGRPDCRYEFCDADATDTCLPMIGPDSEGRQWARTTAGASLHWKTRASFTHEQPRLRSSPWTAPAVVQLPPLATEPPVPPEQCEARPSSPYMASIQWRDRSDDEYGFELRACLADQPESCRRLALVDRDTEQFALHGLPANTTLTLHLNAFNAAGSSPKCTASLSMPADESLVSAVAAWTSHFGMAQTESIKAVEYTTSLSRESADAEVPLFDTACTSRRTLLSSVSPGYIPEGQRRFDGREIEIFSIDDNVGLCPRGGCGLQAFGTTDDAPDCYRWLGEVVHAPVESSVPEKPGIKLETHHGDDVMRWIRSDTGTEVDSLNLCGENGERPLSELAPPYQMDRYGRLVHCQTRPWSWTGE